ncbi:MAG: glycosyltransferase family 1 protein, partial [Pseudomonadota bacterium]
SGFSHARNGAGMTLYINGRFLTQPVSGVQRFAREIVCALDDLIAKGRGSFATARVLVPQGIDAPAYRTLDVCAVPGGHGHLWEQGALTVASRDGVLLSLGNAGPLLHRNHVVCFHDAHLWEMPEAFTPAYRFLHSQMRPRLAKKAAALLTVSDHSMRTLAPRLGVSMRSFTIVPNSAEHMMRGPINADVPRRYGLAPGGYLLSVGNQSPNKNITALTAAHAAVADRALPLALVGGVAPGVAQADATGAGVIRLGRVPDADLRGLYEGAAAFVFPSLNEGFGIPPLEAMQLGVPVLCAATGAMPQVLGDGPVWMDPRDTHDMARGLVEISALGGEARAARISAGHTVAARYRWRSSAETVLDVISGVTSASVFNSATA